MDGSAIPNSLRLLTNRLDDARQPVSIALGLLQAWVPLGEDMLARGFASQAVAQVMFWESRSSCWAGPSLSKC